MSYNESISLSRLLLGLDGGRKWERGKGRGWVRTGEKKGKGLGEKGRKEGEGVGGETGRGGRGWCAIGIVIWQSLSKKEVLAG